MRISQEAFERMVDGAEESLRHDAASTHRAHAKLAVGRALREADISVDPEPRGERLVRENADAAMSPGRQDWAVTSASEAWREWAQCDPPAEVAQAGGTLRVVGSLVNAGELLVSDGQRIYGLRVREVGK